jgi:hypothetical protein
MPEIKMGAHNNRSIWLVCPHFVGEQIPLSLFEASSDITYICRRLRIRQAVHNRNIVRASHVLTLTRLG